MAPIPLLALSLWCTALTACDLRARRLPDALTLPGAVVVLAYGFAVGTPIPALAGAALLTLPYLLVHLARPGALGAGDVKLAVGLGAATALGGAPTWTWAAVAAPMLTAAAALGTLLTCPPRLPRPRKPAAPGHDSPARNRPRALRTPAVWAFPERAGTLPGTLAHGPAMCVASVIALAAGR
ncbi:prepilin peptidase [Nocardia sp. NPDC059240]|uniref:prepilin peptidase n=1 Tax=Nocardia sp. NPDC059240 TaxID=3346786 RepID=UPI00369A67D1